MCNLTRRRLSALSAAEAAYNRRGLQKRGKQYYDLSSPYPEGHSLGTVHALESAGYLQRWAGDCMHITDAGRFFLEAWRRRSEPS